MMELHTWIPLDAAINRFSRIGIGSSAYLELLEAMSTPLQKQVFGIKTQVIRKSWMVECYNIMQIGRPLLKIAPPSWKNVCMPVAGWNALYLLRESINTMAWALETGIKEVYATYAGDRPVHQLAIKRGVVSERAHSGIGAPRFPSFPKSIRICHGSYSFRTICGVTNSKQLLTKDSAAITCMECRATMVERILE